VVGVELISCSSVIGPPMNSREEELGGGKNAASMVETGWLAIYSERVTRSMAFCSECIFNMHSYMVLCMGR